MRRVFLLFLLILPVTVHAQDDPESVVLDAIARLSDGYTFTTETTTAQTFTTAEATEFSSFTGISAEGTVAPNGDHRLTLTTSVGESTDALAAEPIFTLERIGADEIIYVNFDIPDERATSQFDMIAPGWWRADDLLAQIDEEPIRIALQNLVNFPLIGDLPLDAAYILNVTEAEPDTIDGTAMRVFDLEMNALAVLIDETEDLPGQQFTNLIDDVRLLTASDLTLTYRLWIGADDGLLYRGESSARTYLPYLSSGNTNVGFDLDSESTLTFTLSDHGAAVEITPPDPANINE